MRLCAAFAGVGASVAIVGRSEQGLEAAREAVEQAGTRALVLVGDMTDEAEAARVVAETVEELGRLDILVNAIGGGIVKVLSPAEDFPVKDWDWVMDLNLRTQFLVSKAAAKAMIDGGHGGRILNISSVRGQLGVKLGFSPYVAAKAAMNGLTRQHATEWAKYGITVNAIAPTFVAHTAGREPARRRHVQGGPSRAYPARPDRRSRRSRRGGALFLLGRLVVRHRAGADDGRRLDSMPVTGVVA